MCLNNCFKKNTHVTSLHVSSTEVQFPSHNSLAWDWFRSHSVYPRGVVHTGVCEMKKCRSRLRMLLQGKEPQVEITTLSLSSSNGIYWTVCLTKGLALCLLYKHERHLSIRINFSLCLSYSNWETFSSLFMGAACWKF